MLGRHVLVAELLRFGFGAVEDLVQLARGSWLRVALLGIAVDFARDLLAQLRDAGAELLEHGNDDTLILLEEGCEQVQVEDDRIAVLRAMPTASLSASPALTVSRSALIMREGQRVPGSPPKRRRFVRFEPTRHGQ